MAGLLPNVDPEGLLEYSVVYTDRALNHMSASFQQVMCDISAMLRDVYQAEEVAVVPGSGTFGMEAVARQLATGKRCLIIRNGWFSFRWTQILDKGQIASETKVMTASRSADGPQVPFAPPPVESVVQAIKEFKPDVVFAPHVETSAGMILPDDYLEAVGEAVRSVDGLFVLDCIASGTVWVDMSDRGVDVLISAPQKGWSGPPCSGLVMLGERAIPRVEASESTSFACDLKQWLQIMRAYLGGGHAYHATMPTDSLRVFRDVMQETLEYGKQQACDSQWQLGKSIRKLLEEQGFISVAAPGFQAPGVVVSYTEDPGIHTGASFKSAGIQIAKGVPLRCGEGDEFQTFRIGLFGLDKLKDVDGAVARFRSALESFKS